MKKIIKLSKYWWHYNLKRLDDGKSISALFFVSCFIYFPVLLLLALKDGIIESIKENKQRRKEFWDGYK